MSHLGSDRIVYDVSVSIDGFIAGPDADISRFAHEGPIVEDYAERLLGYAVALMGRHTYEFGYRFGLAPGTNPYPHMRSIVLSRSIDLPPSDGIEVVRDGTLDFVRELKSSRGEATDGAAPDGPIYLCGGGELAGSLARAGLVDRLRLKRVPVLLGGGTPLFGKGAALHLDLVTQRDYGDGALLQEFTIGDA